MMKHLPLILLFACNGGNISAQALLELDDTDALVTYGKLVNGSYSITGVVKGAPANAKVAIKLTDDASASALLAASVDVTGNAPFTLAWPVPLGLDRETKTLTVSGTVDGKDLPKKVITLTIDTLVPAFTSFSAKPSLTTAGTIDLGFEVTGRIASFELIVGGSKSTHASTVRSIQIPSLGIGQRTTIALTAIAENEAKSTVNDEAAAGVLFVKSTAPGAGATGSFVHPYSSATAAIASLASAAIPVTLRLLPGEYSAATGENFPLLLTGRIGLEGELDADGAPTVTIKGYGAKDLVIDTNTYASCSSVLIFLPGGGTERTVPVKRVRFLYADGVACQVVSAVVAFNATLSMNETVLEGWPNALSLTGQTCTVGNLDKVIVKDQLASGDTGSIVTSLAGSLRISNSQLLNTINGIKLDYNVDSLPQGPAGCPSNAINGTRIEAKNYGVCVSDELTLSLGSSGGTRNHFIVSGGTATQGECDHVGLGMRQSGNSMLPRVSICDTDIDMGAIASGSPDSNVESWPAAIHVGGGELRAGVAGDASSCTLGGDTQVSVADNRINGLTVRNGASLDATLMRIEQSATNFTAKRSAGLLIHGDANGRNVEIASSTIVGFSRNVYVFGVDASAVLTVSLDDVCLNGATGPTGSDWADGPGQDVGVLDNADPEQKGFLSSSLIADGLLVYDEIGAVEMDERLNVLLNGVLSTPNLSTVSRTANATACSP